MLTSAYHSLLAVTFAVSGHALSQTVPDAGRVLQELAVPPEPIPSSVDVKIQSPDLTGEPPEDGLQIKLRAVRFNGVTRFDESALREVVHEALGKSHSLSGLRDLARQITQLYRERGYPFARAYLPPQRMADGELLIEVIEGRYGSVAAIGEADLASQAQPFLAALQPGGVIQNEQLERAALVLGSLPGIVLAPVIKPGERVGTGDLEARIGRGPVFEGALRADNHGNRYSGRHRGLATARWNSPFTFGDQLSSSALLTDEGMWFGQLAYSLPIGVSGLRVQAGYAHTRYELGKEFASLGATGTAKIATAGFTYPLIRTRAHNLLMSVQYQHKDLHDEYRTVEVNNNKSSHSMPVTLQFDMRDQFAGGGMSYGAFTWTPGELSLDSRDLRFQDRLTANTQGGFQKLTLDVARLQRLPDNFSLYGRFAGQLADKNLDSSESYSLGGANGVRAYPQGEGTGDKGWLTQLELRYAAGDFAPYLFYDFGKVTRKVTPWLAGENHRSLAGFGAGMRWTHKRLNVDISAGWRAHGGRPESDTHDNEPRMLLSAEYRL